MIKMTVSSASPLDAELIRAAEAEIKARQSAEDETWALHALIAEAEDGYIGPEATQAFLQEMIARAEAAS